MDLLQQKWEQEKKQALVKLREEIALKNERIKELEKNEKRALSDKEKAESYARQIKEAQERVKSVSADRDMIENEKKIMEEKIKKMRERIADLEEMTKRKWFF